MLLLLLACTSDGTILVPTALDVGSVAPDFALDDVNPDSPSFEQTLAVSQYLERGSAWYFGHST